MKLTDVYICIMSLFTEAHNVIYTQVALPDYGQAWFHTTPQAPSIARANSVISISIVTKAYIYEGDFIQCCGPYLYHNVTCGSTQ